MKTVDRIVGDVASRLRTNWNRNLDPAAPDWPHTFPLGSETKIDRELRFGQLQQAILDLRSWARSHQLTLIDTQRKVHGTTQPIPSHITIPNIETAAALCGSDWVTRIGRGRRRLTVLRDHGFAGDLPRTVRDIDNYTDVDFDLLCSTAEWFRRHSDTARGLTPRQVPVPGLQAKWLNSRHHLIAALADLPDLGLKPSHPPRIHFTYLDPDHRAAGARWHDSASVGDAMKPAYPPRVVIITENKDTAVGFPPVPGGIALEGAGTGGSTPAAIGWLRDCPIVVYWGDLDAAGLTILHQYREAGLKVISILMDIPTYDTYAEFGTNLDAKGNPIKVAVRKPLPTLNDAERALYERLTDPTWTGYRRVEQERIPLDHASAALLGTINAHP